MIESMGQIVVVSRECVRIRVLEHPLQHSFGEEVQVRRQYFPMDQTR